MNVDVASGFCSQHQDAAPDQILRRTFVRPCLQLKASVKSFFFFADGYFTSSRLLYVGAEEGPRMASIAYEKASRRVLKDIMVDSSPRSPLAGFDLIPGPVICFSRLARL